MRLLRAATLTTADPAAAARRYVEWFGYVLVEAGEVSAALAASWGAPAMAGRRYTVIAPESGVPVYLRFVEATPVPNFRPLRSYGWGAIELCVADVLAVNERMLGAPFTVIGPPKALDGAPAIWPMQVQGPDGEVVFLTEIRADEPGARLPRAACAVDCLFIAVLACQDIAATRGWFAEQLGLQGGPDFELAYTTLSRAFGLPVEHKHRIAVLAHGEDAFLQLDQYPAAATPRTVPPGELPPGVAMVSFALPGLAMGARQDGIIYGGQRSAVWHTPEGALVEIIK
jgi:catechol 2,3-dioxygenase-like lactoylglutathione lyase family enzyme